MKAITQEWLKFAETDVKAAEKLLEDKFLNNIVVFHSQQAVEKCFKAILEENNLKVPKIHSLLSLSGKIREFINFTIDEDKLESLDDVYTASRYPGDLGLLPSGMPTYEEALAFYEFAKEIYEKTVKLLSSV